MTYPSPQDQTASYPPAEQYQQPAQPPMQQQYAQQYPQYPPAPYGSAAPKQGQNGLGIAGFVCGLLGLIFCWLLGFGLVLALLGIIMGGVGISSARKKNQGSGLGIAGLVLGIISLIPAILVIVVIAGASH